MTHSVEDFTPFIVKSHRHVRRSRAVLVLVVAASSWSRGSGSNGTANSLKTKKLSTVREVDGLGCADDHVA